MDKPFAITLDVGSSLANETGSWREERPLYVHRRGELDYCKGCGLCMEECPCGAIEMVPETI